MVEKNDSCSYLRPLKTSGCVMTWNRKFKCENNATAAKKHGSSWAVRRTTSRRFITGVHIDVDFKFKNTCRGAPKQFTDFVLLVSVRCTLLETGSVGGSTPRAVDRLDIEVMQPHQTILQASYDHVDVPGNAVSRPRVVSATQQAREGNHLLPPREAAECNALLYSSSDDEVGGDYPETDDSDESTSFLCECCCCCDDDCDEECGTIGTSIGFIFGLFLVILVVAMMVLRPGAFSWSARPIASCEPGEPCNRFRAHIIAKVRCGGLRLRAVNVFTMVCRSC